MAFFMPYYTSMHDQMIEDRRQQTGKHRTLVFFCLLSSVICHLTPAHAESIAVNKAEARFNGDNYQLSADFDIHFNFVVDQALTRGVPLYFISEFSLTRPRWYWLDEVVAQSEQTTRLSYNALTRQYRIARGPLFQNFSSLDDALRIIGHQAASPIDAALLRQDEGYIAAILPKKDGDYIAAVRLRLRLKSGWERWSRFRPRCWWSRKSSSCSPAWWRVMACTGR